MNDWLTKNWHSLLIAFVTLMSTFALYGYRIDALEKRNDIQDAKIEVLADSNIQTQIDIAKIQKDIEFIRIQLSRVLPTL